MILVSACDSEKSTKALPFSEDKKTTCSIGSSQVDRTELLSRPNSLAENSENSRGPSSMASARGQGTAQYRTPTIKLKPEEWPSIADDLDFSGMLVALDKQIARFERKRFFDLVTLGNDEFNFSWIKKSHKTFRNLVASYIQCREAKGIRCDWNFEQTLRRDFNLYMPKLEPGDARYNERQQTLFTGYYTPTIYGSTTRSAKYPYPVYQKPKNDDLLRRTERVKIDFENAFLGRGLELFYTDDLFSLYLMQVEGGGRVILDSGDKQVVRYLSYDGTNNRDWQFISHYMLAKGYIGDAGIESQREFLENFPEKQKEIYSTCPSYVYFRKTDHPPLGSDNVTLTPNRSLATDDELYKFKGLIAYVTSRRPVERSSSEFECDELSFRAFSRFYLDQDTGGAIVGKSRADLYFGEDEYAELASHNLVQRGQIYFLMLKP